MDKTKIKLTHPFEVDGQRHEELCMRRAKVRDQQAAYRAGSTDAEREVRLFANLCEVAPEVIEEVDLADYQKLQETFEGFVSG